MTTEELKIKLKEIKSRYYTTYGQIMSTDDDFVSKLSKELTQLGSYPEIWDISSTKPFKYKYNYLERSFFKVYLSNSENRLLEITI